VVRAYLLNSEYDYMVCHDSAAASSLLGTAVMQNQGKPTPSGKQPQFLERHPAWPGRAVVLRIEPLMASRPFGIHR
jgi:hypothetical protein